MNRYAFTVEEATEVGTAIGIEWNDVDFDPADLAAGMKVELEHGSKVDERVNITNDDAEMTAEIAWAHLMEDPDYYIMLDEMEGEMDDVRTPELRKEGMTMRRAADYDFDNERRVLMLMEMIYIDIDAAKALLHNKTSAITQRSAQDLVEYLRDALKLATELERRTERL